MCNSIMPFLLTLISACSIIHQTGIKNMTSTLVGKYNYKTATQIHIPAMGASEICLRLHNRLPYVKTLFDPLLLNRALEYVIAWRDSGRKFSSYSTRVQTHIWNAYAMAVFERNILKNVIVENYQIRYKADIPIELTHEELIADEERAMKDHFEG